MGRKRNRQDQIVAWAVQYGRPFTTVVLQKALRISDNAAYSALQKLRESGRMKLRSKTRPFLYALPAYEEKPPKKEEPTHGDIQTHVLAYAVGYITAWTDCYAASHSLPAATLARRVGEALQATPIR
jgi:hypothetical protein